MLSRKRSLNQAKRSGFFAAAALNDTRGNRPGNASQSETALCLYHSERSPRSEQSRSLCHSERSEESRLRSSCHSERNPRSEGISVFCVIQSGVRAAKNLVFVSFRTKRRIPTPKPAHNFRRNEATDSGGQVLQPLLIVEYRETVAGSMDKLNKIPLVCR